MTTHVQHNQLVPNQAEMNLPRPSMVAAIAGAVLAGLLFLSSLPLLAAGGLWLLGLALVLIAYTFAANRQVETPEWGMALVGQGLGLLGMALLLGASLLA